MSDERVFETTLEIDAPPERVWQALTEGEELARWFPLEAQVEPGEGGRVMLSWGPEMTGDAGIEIWEPNRRLRTVESLDRPWTSAGDAAAGTPRRIAVDYHLEGRDGKTVLRLVHSGFGRGADWDDEYDAIANGWKFELRSLRHYLTRHDGRDRRVGLARRAVSLSPAEAMDRLLGPEGLCREGSLRRLGEGDAYVATDFEGSERRGVVIVPASPAQFAATVRNRDDALLRVMCEPMGGAPQVWLWWSDWSGDAETARRFEDTWSRRLDELFVEETA